MMRVMSGFCLFLIISVLFALVIVVIYIESNNYRFFTQSRGVLEKTATNILSLDDIDPHNDGIAADNCLENGIKYRKCCPGACRITQNRGAKFHPWALEEVFRGIPPDATDRDGGTSGVEDDYDGDDAVNGGHKSRNSVAEHLNSLQEMLVALQDALGGQQGQCRIVHIGDSLMDDQRSAQVCQMMQMGYTIDHFEGLTGARESIVRDDFHYQELLHAKADSPLEPVSSTFITLVRNSTERQPVDEQHRLLEPIPPCNTVQLIKLPPHDLIAYPSLHALMKGSLVLLNWEVRCNSRQCMEDTIKELIAPAAEIASKNGAFDVIWRSAETQHFHTEDGSGRYTQLLDRDSCAEITDPSESWYRKNVIQHDFLDNYPNMSVVPVGMWSLPDYWMHHPGDCTHYCYAPARFTRVWRSIRDILRRRVMRRTNP